MGMQEDFIEAASQHGASTQKGDSKAANEAYARLAGRMKKIRKEADRGKAFLEEAIRSEDSSVVCWAALYLLPLNEKAAKEALAMLAAQPTGIDAFNARMTLREWKAGRLKVE
jgi:hypothetical protein